MNTSGNVLTADFDILRRMRNAEAKLAYLKKYSVWKNNNLATLDSVLKVFCPLGIALLCSKKWETTYNIRVDEIGNH